MKIGFIGFGNMATAIVKGLLKTHDKNEIFISDVSDIRLTEARNKYGLSTGDNVYVAGAADIVFLAVKPNVLSSVLEEIKGLVGDKIVVSIAAGKSIADIEKVTGHIKIVRLMPNTPALVGEGMTAAAFNDMLKKEEKEYILGLLNSFGKVEEVEEKHIAAITALSGSSPAYIYMVIEAMADAGVLLGLPRQKAYNIAAQSVLGSAKMVLETGEHPGKLKDDVCSPGGTTIAAVKSLEKNGLRSTFIEAIEASYNKCIQMSKNNH